jgi:KipI family sensor histidine kinase inhibitor
LLACGPRAVLAEYGSLAEVMGAAAAVRHAAPAGLVDVVPAARTVLVTVDRSGHLPAVRGLLEHPPATAQMEEGELVVLPVRYDGADLDAVAAATGLAVDEVVRLHAAGEYTVAFCGFMPGFAYLAGLDPRLHLPRRPTPRTRVPAGSVAIAAEFTAVYPSPSPGGWHLLGTTATQLPALLAPGMRVRFEAVT